MFLIVATPNKGNLETDPDEWDRIQQEIENEKNGNDETCSEPKPIGLYQQTKKLQKENDFTIQVKKGQYQTREVLDWENKKVIMQERELKKMVFNYRVELGISDPADIIETQTEYKSSVSDYQRGKLSKIRTPYVEKLADQ